MAKKEFNPREPMKLEGKTIFENFSAIDGKYPANYPCFDLIVDPELARFLTDNGFNVPIYDSRINGPTNHIKININFQSKTPPVIRLAKRDPNTGQIKPAKRISEATLRYLDGYKRNNMICDIECMPYSKNRDEHYTLWLNSGIFIVDEDYIESKYEIAEDDYNPDPIPDDPF